MFWNRYIYIIFILFTFVHSTLMAGSGQFRFTHYTTDDGLSQSNVTTIIQDQLGFMWFGTFNGLNKFDGYNFEVFTYDPENPGSLSDNFISVLFEDSKGRLWVGTSDGLNRFNRSFNSFVSYKHLPDQPGSLSDNQIETICEDHLGRIWIGTRNGGINVFDSTTESFKQPFETEGGNQVISSSSIRTLFWDSRNNLWIAHWDGTIDVVSGMDSIQENITVSTFHITSTPVTDMLETPDGAVWIATQGDGIYKTGFSNGRLTELIHYTESDDTYFISSDIILTMMLDSESNLWIGTEDKGIDIIQTESGVRSHIQYDPYNAAGLNHDSVWKIFEDRDGNIWIGTYAHGINFLPAHQMQIEHISFRPGKKHWLNHSMINVFVEDGDGNIWIGTDGGGLNRFNRQNNIFQHFTSANSKLTTDIIVSLAVDNQKRIWIGTWSDGLFQFAPSTGTWKHFNRKNAGLGSNRILHILPDGNGGLWLSTYWGGLTYFQPDNKTVKIYNKHNSRLSDDNVRVTCFDDTGNLWIGTDIGVDVLDISGGHIRNYVHRSPDSASITKGFVNDIICDKRGTIWIGTTGGLNKFESETGRFIHFTTANGLPDNDIKCIVEDDSGNIWLSTNHGISTFDLNVQMFKNYDISDGLQGNEFNRKSGLKTSADEILFGGNNGFNIFHGIQEETNRIIPPVYITSLKILNKPVQIGGKNSPLQSHISISKEVRLSYRENVITFEFAALNYINPGKNQYAYMMEGFDTDWSYVGNKRTATYTNLDPGRYVFKVKAANNDGLWNEQGTSVAIIIAPPFWKTWWAYLVEILLGLAFLAFVANYFISRQKLKNALKMEHLELEKMFEMDQMKTKLFTNISHELYSPLSLILSPVEKLLASGELKTDVKEMLQLVYRNAIRLQRITNQLKDFQKMEGGDFALHLYQGDIFKFIKEIYHSFTGYAVDHGIHYRYLPDREKHIAWFDPDKLDKIIYNLLSNAFKYTPDNGEIALSVAVKSRAEVPRSEHGNMQAETYLEIGVRDSGKGIPEDKVDKIFHRYFRINDSENNRIEGIGVGLAFVTELVKLYHGEIMVNSEVGRGTLFTIYLPLDAKYLEEQLLVEDFRTTLPESQEFARFEDSFPSESDVSGNIREKAAGDLPIVLVVEDDQEVREYIRHEFSTYYRVETAENGQLGLEKAFELIPDVIISDIKMPEMTGIQLCNTLKADERTSHIPLILLTASVSVENRIEGLQKGADAYIAKPFNIDVLRAQVVNLLLTRKKLRERYTEEIIHGRIQKGVEDPDEKFLKKVAELVEEHLSDSGFNAEKLGKLVGMSRMQLYRKIRSITDQTVHEFIRSIRLKKAAEMLTEKRMTITEVAYAVGFNDLTYFARCFRKQYHQSPSEYAKR